MSVNLCFNKTEAFFLHSILRSVDPGRNKKARDFLDTTLNWLKDYYGAPADDDMVSGSIYLDRCANTTAEKATQNWGLQDGFHQTVVIRDGKPVAVFHNPQGVYELKDLKGDIHLAVPYYVNADDYKNGVDEKKKAALAKLTNEERELLGI